MSEYSEHDMERMAKALAGALGIPADASAIDAVQAVLRSKRRIDAERQVRFRMVLDSLVEGGRAERRKTMNEIREKFPVQLYAHTANDGAT